MLIVEFSALIPFFGGLDVTPKKFLDNFTLVEWSIVYFDVIES